MHATRAATPAVMWTTIPPAKSKTPMSANQGDGPSARVAAVAVAA
jgi:hypothetical protein